MDSSRKRLRTSDGMHLLTLPGRQVPGAHCAAQLTKESLQILTRYHPDLGGGSLCLRGSCEGRLNGLHHDGEKQFRGCHVMMIVSSSMRF